MDPEDIVTPDVVAFGRKYIRSYRTRLLAWVNGGALLFGSVIGLILRYDKNWPLHDAVLFGGIGFAVISALPTIHWVRHFRALSGQLDDVEHRVAKGEIIYASQIKWRSYK